MIDSIDIRLSTDADSDRIRDLAQLDGRREPHGDVLLAERGGRLVAAIGMDGTVVADPFEPTADIVSMLRSQLAGGRKRAPRAGRWLGRLLPTG